MGQIREIKKRMVAVKNIQRITKTMQMIATAKFTSALQRARATQPYAAKIREMVAEVAAAAGDVEHPLLTGPSEIRKRELLLVIVSDRGLCGAYNTNVLRTAHQHLRTRTTRGVETVVETSGKKATAFFRFARIPVANRHTVFGDKPAYEEVQRLAERYMNEFAKGEYDAVHVASTRFISNTRQVAEIAQLLPLSRPSRAGDAAGSATQSRGPEAQYDFSPSSSELLAELLPESVKVVLFQAFNDAIVSEQVMRMVAMKAATDNAKGLGKDLRRKFNRARQAQITTELMEVIAGAAALE
ncbi:MAG: ATP synthase F1 subunit gamma [Phycisphaerales bacterium]